MFHRTIAAKPLRRYTSHAPDDRNGNLFAAVLKLPESAAIRNYLEIIRNSPEMTRIERDIFEDLKDMRSNGLLGGQLEAPGRNVAFIESWNRFIEGDNDQDLARIVVGPVIRIIESDAVLLFHDRKKIASPIRGHDDAPLNMDAARRRLSTVEAELEKSLLEGSSARRHAGIPTDHDGSGLIRVRMEGFRPILEHARKPAANKRVETWRRIELFDLERDPLPEPAI